MGAKCRRGRRRRGGRRGTRGTWGEGAGVHNRVGILLGERGKMSEKRKI